MGNGQGKPVVFTDEGPFPCIFVVRIIAEIDPNVRSSQSQSFPPASSRRERRLWQSQDRRTQRFWLDIRSEVYQEG